MVVVNITLVSSVVVLCILRWVVPRDTLLSSFGEAMIWSIVSDSALLLRMVLLTSRFLLVVIIGVVPNCRLLPLTGKGMHSVGRFIVVSLV